MVTLRDVAREADASVGSVSTVVNGGRVRPALRERIEAAMRRLDYVPDRNARALRTGDTRALGLVISDISNPHFASLAAAVEESAAALGYALIVCTTKSDPVTELRNVMSLRGQRVGGLLLNPIDRPGDGYDELAELLRLPVVLIDKALPNLARPAVCLDNEAACFEATRHLLGLGHRRLGIVTGAAGWATSDERLAGFRRACAEAGVAVRDADVVEGRYRIDGAERAARDLLGRKVRPTAVVSTNNQTSIGVVRAVRELGLACPGDVALACIDDFPWADAFSPRLTTVAQPVAEIGRLAVTLLVEQIEGQTPAGSRVHRLEGTLVVRESSAG